MPALNANLNDYSTIDVYAPLPPGEYEVTIVDSEIRETRRGDNMLSFTYEVDSGDYRGRKVFDNLNIWNSNPKAVEIAMRQLKSIATAAGYKNPNYIGDSSDLHGLRMKLRLAIRENDGEQYQDVKAYMPLKDSRQTAPQPPKPAGQTPLVDSPRRAATPWD